ncbi:MAG: class I SAM-dependent methyltransferase [Bacteroidota bacterium]
MDTSKQAANLFHKYAKRYQDKYMSVALYSSFLDEFCNRIAKADARILELGCGPGNITKYILEKHPEYHVLGIDLAPAMIELARINNPGASFQVMDMRNIGELKAQYNGLIMGFCTPYLSRKESEQLIDKACRLLLPGSTLYLSTMEGDYSKSGYQGPSDGGSDRIYIYYHEADYLIQRLKKNGYKDIKVYRQEFPVEEGPAMTDLIIIASK